MKKFALLTLVFAFVVAPLTTRAPVFAANASDWQAGNIIGDPIFTDASSMSVGQIQDFLNQQVPSCDIWGTQPATEYGRSDLTHAQYAATRGWAAPPYVCLKNYFEVPKTSPSTAVPDNSYNHYDAASHTLLAVPGGVSAAQLIYNAAQQYNISPKVLLVMIQKESAGPLTVDSWPLASQYMYPLGAHCPDTTGCDPNYSGFSIQIAESAGLLRWYLDNMNQPWWTYKKLGNNNILYNPSSSCGASNVNIVSSATAALYTYTPYQPNDAALKNLYGLGDSCSAYGNRNFWRIFTDWFGSTIRPCYPTDNVTSAGAGERVYGFTQNGQTNYGVLMANNTGSGCAELHQWAPGDQSWQYHLATTQPSFDPTTEDMFVLNNGTPNSRLVFVKYQGTANGMVEFHEWSLSQQIWVSHIVTSQPASDVLANGKIVARGNTLVYVKYRSTSTGMVEFHEWSSDLRGWALHAISNQPASEMDSGSIIGKGDSLVFAKYRNTPSGRIEIHEWAPGYQAWTLHAVTNQPVDTLNQW